jgi:hypothetical protein
MTLLDSLLTLLGTPQERRRKHAAWAAGVPVAVDWPRQAASTTS